MLLLARHPFLRSLPLVALASACGGSSTNPITITHDAATGEDGMAAKEDAGHQGDAATTKDTGTTTHADAGTDAEGAGPRVYIRIKAVQTPEGNPGVAAETPTDQNVAVLGVTLLKDKNDPAPLVALALSTPIVTPYNDGSSTLLGSVPASALTSGTYTFIRVPVAYVRFTVAGTAHADGVSVPGDLTDAICLTTGSAIDGATRESWLVLDHLHGRRADVRPDHRRRLRHRATGAGVAHRPRPEPGGRRLRLPLTLTIPTEHHP